MFKEPAQAAAAKETARTESAMERFSVTSAVTATTGSYCVR